MDERIRAVGLLVDFLEFLGMEDDPAGEADGRFPHLIAPASLELDVVPMEEECFFSVLWRNLAGCDAIVDVFCEIFPDGFSFLHGNAPFSMLELDRMSIP